MILVEVVSMASRGREGASDWVRNTVLLKGIDWLDWVDYIRRRLGSVHSFLLVLPGIVVVSLLRKYYKSGRHMLDAILIGIVLRVWSASNWEVVRGDKLE